MFSVTKKFSSICKDIADAIRNKMEIDTKIKLKDFQDYIEAIEYNAVENMINATYSSLAVLKYNGSAALKKPGTSWIEKIIAPNCTEILSAGFSRYYYLKKIILPSCLIVNNAAFMSCRNLSSINLLKCESIGENGFASCSNLHEITLPSCVFIGSRAFYSCNNFISLYLPGSNVCQLDHSNAFLNAAIKSIYVPASLLDVYQSATNWAVYKSKICII